MRAFGNQIEDAAVNTQPLKSIQEHILSIVGCHLDQRTTQHGYTHPYAKFFVPFLDTPQGLVQIMHKTKVSAAFY